MPQREGYPSKGSSRRSADTGREVGSARAWMREAGDFKEDGETGDFKEDGDNGVSKISIEEEDISNISRVFRYFNFRRNTFQRVTP